VVSVGDSALGGRLFEWLLCLGLQRDTEFARSCLLGMCVFGFVLVGSLQSGRLLVATW